MSQSRIFNVANISFNVIRQNVNAICTNKILAKFSNLQLIRISVHSQPPKSSEERQRGMINDPNIKSDQEEEPRRLVASDGRASILSSKATQTPENFEYSEHYDKFRRKDTPKIAIGKQPPSTRKATSNKLKQNEQKQSTELTELKTNRSSTTNYTKGSTDKISGLSTNRSVKHLRKPPMVKVDTSQGNLVAVSELQSATTGYAQKMTRKRMKEKVYYGLWRSAFAKAVKETSKPQITTPRKNENKYGDHTSKSKGLIQKVPVKMAQRGNKEVLTLRKDNDMLSIENGQDTHRNTTVTKQTFKEKHIKKELQKRQDPKGTKPLQPKLTES